MRRSGFVTLPSERTLRDFTHYYKSDVGFSSDLNRQIVEQSGIKSLPESRRYVCLILDEMKLKEDLVYDKKTGKIIGFTSLGDVNDLFNNLEKECLDENHSKHPPVADHILVFMVRGIFFKFNFPYAHFPTRGIVGDTIYVLVWKAITQLELLGFKVLCVTADGASPNRNFFKMNGYGMGVYKTKNSCADPEENRPLYFMSDVPHLIKTTRNCWSHSGISGTRLLTVC